MSSQTNLLFPGAPSYLHQVLRVIDLGRRVGTRKLEEPATTEDAGAHDFYLPLIQKMIQVRQSRPDGALLTFASVSNGAGESLVTESVAWELARRTRERVLIASAVSVSGLVPTHFCELNGRPAPQGGSGECAPKVWRLAQTYCDNELAPPTFHSQSMELLRRWFGYILVECPDIREMAAPWQINSLSDGVLLVVGAGRTTRNEIAQARELVDASSVRTLGLILNQRTQPIPSAIYRRL